MFEIERVRDTERKIGYSLHKGTETLVRHRERFEIERVNCSIIKSMNTTASVVAIIMIYAQLGYRKNDATVILTFFAAHMHGI